MKVIFIKDHPVGIKKGTETEATPEDAQRWVNQGYVKADGLKAEEPKNGERTDYFPKKAGDK